VKLKVKDSQLIEMNRRLITNKNRKKEFEAINIKDERLKNKKLNLIVIWSNDGCGVCKEEMASEFINYKKKFGAGFKFVFIGSRDIQPKVFGVNKYLTLLVKSGDEIFSSRLKITQPIALLTNYEGHVLLAHEMVPGDTLGFSRFNSNAIRILRLSQ